MQEQARETSAPVGPPVEIGLKEPRFWSVQFAVVFSFLLVASGVYYFSAIPRLSESGATLVDYLPHLVTPLAACLAACLAALVGRLLQKPKRVAPLVYHEQHVMLPRHADARRALLVPYEDIRSVELRGRGATERLFIGTPGRLFSFPRHAFVSPSGIEQALRELYQHILRLPQGSRIVERIALNRRHAVAITGNSVVVSQSLLGLYAAFFVLEFFAGGGDSPLGALRFGAVSPVLVRSGEVYRLFSSTLLHANVLHLYLDGLGVFFLGAMLERLLGHTRFALVFVVSSLAGTLVSTLAGQGLFAVGGSGGVFGLLGAVAVVNHRFRGQLPLGFAQSLRFWWAFALVIGALSLVVPEIDLVASCTGLGVGILVAFLVLDEKGSFDPQAPASQALKHTATVLVVLFVLAAGTAVAQALASDSRTEQRVARTVLDDPAASPRVLNELAWRIAQSPEHRPELLVLALEGAERAVAAAPNDMAIADTLAAVQYRRGRYEEAIALERGVLAATGEVFAAEHLAKFLRARPAGAASLGVGERATAARLTVTSGAEGVVAPRIVAELTADFPRGVTFLLLGTRAKRVVALVQGTLGPSPKGEYVLSPKGGEPWPHEAQYAVALVESRCVSCDQASPGLTVWNLEVALNDLH